MPKVNTRPLLAALEGDEKKQAEIIVEFGGKFGKLLWFASNGPKSQAIRCGEEFFRDLIEFVLEKED
jgi:hypothetical protein